MTLFFRYTAILDCGKRQDEKFYTSDDIVHSQRSLAIEQPVQDTQSMVPKATEIILPLKRKFTQQLSADTNMQPKSDNYQSSEHHTPTTICHSSETNAVTNKTSSKFSTHANSCILSRYCCKITID